MPWTAPTLADFKSFFDRDFQFAPSDDVANMEYVRDADITKAISEGQINFNSDLFSSTAQATNIFMYLAAFFLVENIKTSMKGIASQARFPIQSNSVGGVSVNFQLPERYTKDPYLASFMVNGYGQKYLSLVLPLLIGNVQLVQGTTTFS